MSPSNWHLHNRGKSRLRPAGYKIFAGRRQHGFGLLWTSAALVALVASQPGHAQTSPSASLPSSTELPSTASGALPAQTAPVKSQRAANSAPQQPVSTAPEFQAGAIVSLSESYVTNASGLPGANQVDYLSTLGFAAYLHEHSRRIRLDINYNGQAEFYAKGTLPTQIENNLQAVGNVDVVPDYFSIGAKAFAQPVVVSNLGIVTADDRVVPNGFRNSYGYYVDPDLRFKIGNFATSDTVPSFGQVFFTNPAGSLNVSPIPGVSGPQDTTSRSLTEKISSGPDFDRLNWNTVGYFSETARSQSLLSEKAAIGNVRFAVSHELSLLATVGYDAISNTIPLTQNVSGPVALGGFGLTFGKDFSVQLEAGEKYNNTSFFGNLRYNISPNVLISASANDYVQTPEGQILNNLTNLVAQPDGTLTSENDVLGNGSPSPLSTFSVQSQGSLSLDQNIARYQQATVSFAGDFDRNHANIGLFGTRRTILSGIFIGSSRVNSVGAQAQLSRDITQLLVGTIGGSYSVNDELGGSERTLQLQSQLRYQLSRQTTIYASVQYLDRSSSAALQALSPLTGSLTDVRATVGLSHAL